MSDDIAEREDVIGGPSIAFPYLDRHDTPTGVHRPVTRAVTSVTDNNDTQVVKSTICTSNEVRGYSDATVARDGDIGVPTPQHTFITPRD